MLMPFQDVPIRRKLYFLIWMACSVAVTAIAAASFAYEYLAIQGGYVRHPSILGQIVAHDFLGVLGVCVVVSGLGALIALFLVRLLHQQISRSILALVGAARAVSERQDYSARVQKFGEDEIGMLTDAFNGILSELEKAERGSGRGASERTEQEIRLSEVRYRTLFSSLDDGFCVIEVLFDTQGKAVDYRFLEASLSFERQTGLRDAVGKRMLELAPHHEAHWFETYGRIAVTGEPVRFQHQAEQLGRWFDVYAFRLGEPGNREVAIFFSDISERKRAEAALTERTAELEAANKELEAFSYSVSHDLRAPLRHVDGFANLLAKRAAPMLDAQSLRYISTISSAAKQMGCLIDDLLSFSRMGRAALRFEKVDQDALVASLVREGHYDADGRVIAWDIAPLPGVCADTAMLRQVWSNLIENAVKYSGKNPNPRIGIGCQPADGNAAEHVFFVRDNGVGFDMAYADKLFGVFQRLHNPADFEGTGIGLANIRRIVARHEGRTWAEGHVGKGAVFYFSLPIKTHPS